MKGNAEDQYLLACCYEHGTEGVKRDKVAAAAWWGKAAAQEHAGAQYDLGACYEDGDGVEQDYQVAVMFYRKAADAGHAVGLGVLGGCYALGKGVEQNDALAVMWWEKGVVSGHAGSQYMLGFCYMHSQRGLPKNARRARSHYDAIKYLKLLKACESCGAPDANRTCGAFGFSCRRCATAASQSKILTRFPAITRTKS